MATINHTSLAVLSMLPIDAVCTRKQHHQSHYGVLSKMGQHPPETNVLISPHLDVEGNKGRNAMGATGQGFDHINYLPKDLL